jgi:hypothetical protein
MAKAANKKSNKEVIKSIAAKRDRLLAERAEIRAKTAELAARDRYIDRELADCRAAARVFDLDLTFPEEERVDQWHLFWRAAERNKARQNDPVLQKRKMPKLADIVLDCLLLVGERGSKAAPIQEYIESTYDTKIHEKTVGMTLYRLLKKGRVRRNGHTWFFVPEIAVPDQAPK